MRHDEKKYIGVFHRLQQVRNADLKGRNPHFNHLTEFAGESFNIRADYPRDSASPLREFGEYEKN
uniref:Uncharacterized protein n=1 Tax=Romanomermis culicivorax TaxID=13658 RepID=A0A915JVP4_ROMCU